MTGFDMTSSLECVNNVNTCYSSYCCSLPPTSTGGGLLAVTGVSKGLLYASCLLFMLPLGSGLNSLAAGLMTQLQRFKGAAQPQQQQQSGSDGSSSSSGGFGGSSYGSSSSSGGSSSSSWSLPRWGCAQSSRVVDSVFMIS